MLIPFMRAASKTEVPLGTRADLPSMLMSIIPGGAATLDISGTNSYALKFSRARRGGKADSARALPLQHVSIDFRAKMLQHGLNRRGSNLAKTANGCLAHRLRKVVEEREISAVLRFGNSALRPANKQVGHFLRPHAARYALPARFVAIKTHSIQRHVEHARGVVANNDCTGAKHRACIGERLEVERHIHHRSGQVTR